MANKRLDGRLAFPFPFDSWGGGDRIPAGMFVSSLAI